MSSRILILTEGYSEPHAGKTAANVIRYRRQDVVAVLDSTQKGKMAAELLQAGPDVPVVGSLDEAPTANALLLGIAPPGGKIPAAWRPTILQAIARGMDIISGLHDFVSDDAEFAAAAKKHQVKLVDIRKNTEKTIARRQGLREDCFRVHTVGHDCSVGKMVASVEITRGLQARGVDAKFVATGQTGILIEGDGCPIDCVVSDFVAGAAEKLVLENQHHAVVLVEGQGSLVHPSYSAVTLGLLHGCAPHALIFCYEVDRTHVAGIESVKLPSLAEFIKIYDLMANVHQPCKFIGVAMNSRRVSAAEAEVERERVRAELGLPVCDVFRHGPGELIDAVEKMRTERLRR